MSDILPAQPGRAAGLTRRRLVQAATAVTAVGSLPRPAVARTVKLAYWSPLDPRSGDPRSRGEAAMLDVFRKQHPGIEVDVQPVPWQVMGQQVIQAVMSGAGPDVAQLSTTNLPDQVGAETAAPLNDVLGKGWSDADRADFLLPWSNTTYDGKIMAAYWSSLLNNQLWYVDDGLQAPPPQTWSALPEWVRPAMQKTGSQGFVTGLSQQGNGFGFAAWLIPALWACGADYVLPDDRAGFANPNGARVFEWLADLVAQKVAPGSIVSLTRDNVLDAMKGRKSVSTLLTSNIVGAARDSLGDSLKLARQPGPNSPCPAFASGKTLIMTTICREKEAAGLLIESMISPEAQLANAKIGNEIPVRRSVLSDPWFQTKEGSDIRFSVEYMAQSQHAFRYPQRTDYLQSRLALAAQQVVGGRPALAALQQAAEDWETARKS